MDLGEISWGGESAEWIQVAQDRGWWPPLVNMAMDRRVLMPELVICNVGKGLTDACSPFHDAIITLSPLFACCGCDGILRNTKLVYKTEHSHTAWSSS
jgi:hypothetical protein